MQAKVNITNPTEYSARIPFIDVHVLHNNTLLGHSVAKDIEVVPGNNTGILIEALWDPSGLSGPNGSLVGRNLLSQYISGFNTTLTLKTHESTIPSQPALGRALSSLEVVIDTPKLVDPGAPDGGDGGGGGDDHGSGPHFIKAATVLSALLALA